MKETRNEINYFIKHSPLIMNGNGNFAHKDHKITRRLCANAKSQDNGGARFYPEARLISTRGNASCCSGRGSRRRSSLRRIPKSILTPFVESKCAVSAFGWLPGGMQLPAFELIYDSPLFGQTISPPPARQYQLAIGQTIGRASRLPKNIQI